MARPDLPAPDSAESEGTSTGPVIQLERVAKRFGDFVAVHAASFEIGRGEFFSMLGPSGCGKTTTLRMIAGFEHLSSGVVRLEGVDVSRTPPHKRNVNTVFQHYALFPHMSIYDNVAFGPRSAKLPRTVVDQRVRELLEVVRLGEQAKRRPAQLSGGQQQRVALARALVNYPSALLLDEPLGALDLKLRQAMQLELKRIQREVGITFVYVTHDQEEALTMSDRIAVMNEGRVEQIGTPSEIYAEPATVFVAGFIGQANLWPARVESLAGERARVQALGSSVEALDRLGVRGEGVLMVRPERVRIMADPPVGVTAVMATLVDIAFLGPVVRLAARASDGSEVVAHLGADADAPQLRPGDPVWVGWDPSAARLLPGSPGEAPSPEAGTPEIEENLGRTRP